MAGALAVHGLRDVQRELKNAEKNIRAGVRKEIRQAAEPVRATAETLAVARVRNIRQGSPWSKMRVGVTQTSVYVAPRQRGVAPRVGARGQLAKRPNLADLLMSRAMEPALYQHQDRALRDIEAIVDREAARFNRTR